MEDQDLERLKFWFTIALLIVAISMVVVESYKILVIEPQLQEIANSIPNAR